MRVLLVLATAAAITMAAAANARPLAAAEPLAAPSNQVAPTITGVAKLGKTLTASPGQWAGTAPISFAYQWSRCLRFCGPIPGATGQTYTVTKADAVTASNGLKTVLSVSVTATNIYGSVSKLVNPGTEVSAPLPRPRTVGLALEEATVIPESTSTIPQILAHNGYRAWYFALHPARVTVTWNRTTDPYGPALAFGHRIFRHAGKAATFKVRLTARGRRLLAHVHHVTLEATGSAYPLRRPGGEGVGVGLALSTDGPAKLVSG